MSRRLPPAIFAVIVLLLILGRFLHQQGWSELRIDRTESPVTVTPSLQEFIPLDGSCRVLFPGVPAFHSRQSGNVTASTFSVALPSDHTLYILMYKEGDPRKTWSAEAERDETLSATGRNFLSERLLNFHGIAGLEFTSSNSSNTIFVTDLYAVGSRLYDLMVVTPSGFKAQSGEAFLNSFQINSSHINQ